MFGVGVAEMMIILVVLLILLVPLLLLVYLLARGGLRRDGAAPGGRPKRPAPAEPLRTLRRRVRRRSDPEPVEHLGEDLRPRTTRW